MLGHSCQHRPAPAHYAGELRGRQRVQHVCPRKPGAAKLQNTVAYLLHVRSVVRVSINDELHASGFGHAQVLVAQIKPEA